MLSRDTSNMEQVDTSEIVMLSWDAIWYNLLKGRNVLSRDTINVEQSDISYIISFSKDTFNMEQRSISKMMVLSWDRMKLNDIPRLL